MEDCVQEEVDLSENASTELIVTCSANGRTIVSRTAFNVFIDADSRSSKRQTRGGRPLRPPRLALLPPPSEKEAK